LAGDAVTAVFSPEDRLAALHHEDRAEQFLDDACYEDAVAQADAALALNPMSCSAWLVRASACKALGRFWEAAEAMEAVLARVPGLAETRINLANIYAALERFSKAEHHLLEAIRLQPSLLEAHVNLGSVYLRMIRYDLAEGPTRYALSLDPGHIAANQNLDMIMAQNRAPEPQANGDAAASREQIFIERAETAGAPVALILSSPGAGNVPYPHLLPRAGYGRIHWYLQYATPGQDNPLPAHDFVFNAIGDPDAAPEAQAAAERFAANCRLPLFNRPDRIARTYRSTVPALLMAIPGVVAPRAERFTSADSDLVQKILDSGLRFPLIVRPAGRHGGEGVERIEEPAALAAQLPAADVLYATEFTDYRSADGWYRKYRAIFVDHKPYPYHLAIGDHWLLHYWTAGMETDAARRDEELRFLRDPESAVGDRAWAALGAIAAELDLDFAGIDFSVLADGKLLFFEANATMLVHPEDEAVFAYKNDAVREITGAMDAMIRKRLAAR
jgi:tetratricopeptide (TPR) repeat protein